MKILILGGSGILSTDFVKLCLDKKNDVYLLNRGIRTTFIDTRAELIKADLRKGNVDTLKEKLSINHYDVIVDFLSYTIEHIQKTLEIVDGLYTQYIFISSATVYIKSNPNEIITENSRIGNKGWDYAYNKSLCENYLRLKNINYTIIRPYVTYGISRIPFPIISDGFNYTLLKRIIDNKPVLLYENGSAICTLTNTKDFAQILYRLLLNEGAYKEAFNVTSSSRQTWKDVYEKYCEILGREKNSLSINKEQVHKYLPEFEQILDADKGQNMLFDNSKVLNAIGSYHFEYDLLKGLKESVDFYIDNNSMQAIDYKFDGRCDFFIKMEYNIKLKAIKSSNPSNNNKIWYFIMTKRTLRLLFTVVKKLKQVIRGK